jgi:hypothetical protein
VDAGAILEQGEQLARRSTMEIGRKRHEQRMCCERHYFASIHPFLRADEGQSSVKEYPAGSIVYPLSFTWSKFTTGPMSWKFPLGAVRKWRVDRR